MQIKKKAVLNMLKNHLAIISKRTQKGFTLIEVVICLTVIAVISGVLVPSLLAVFEGRNEALAREAINTSYAILREADLANDYEYNEVHNGYIVFFDNDEPKYCAQVGVDGNLVPSLVKANTVSLSGYTHTVGYGTDAQDSYYELFSLEVQSDLYYLNCSYVW